MVTADTLTNVQISGTLAKDRGAFGRTASPRRVVPTLHPRERHVQDRAGRSANANERRAVIRRPQSRSFITAGRNPRP